MQRPDWTVLVLFHRITKAAHRGHFSSILLHGRWTVRWSDVGQRRGRRLDRRGVRLNRTIQVVQIYQVCSDLTHTDNALSASSCRRCDLQLKLALTTKRSCVRAVSRCHRTQRWYVTVQTVLIDANTTDPSGHGIFVVLTCVIRLTLLCVVISHVTRWDEPQLKHCYVPEAILGWVGV